jgi:hypothetical protein
MKVGDLVMHIQRNQAGVIVEKLAPARWSPCNVWLVLFADGLSRGTDNNLYVVYYK